MAGINKSQTKLQHAGTSSMTGCTVQVGDKAQASANATEPLFHQLTFSKLQSKLSKVGGDREDTQGMNP